MFEKGWRLPGNEARSPKSPESSRYLNGIRRLAYHFGAVADLSAATREFLQEENVSVKLRSMLEFGLRYHEAGLSTAMSEFDIPTEADDLLRTPEKQGRDGVAHAAGARTTRKPECCDVIAIVGAETVSDGVEFDCFLIVEGDTHDVETVRVGAINSSTGLVSLKDGFYTGQSGKLTAEQVCPPQYLAKK